MTHSVDFIINIYQLIHKCFVHCNLVKPPFNNHDSNPHSHLEADILCLLSILRKITSIVKVPLNNSINKYKVL